MSGTADPVTELPKPKQLPAQVSVDVNNPTSLYLDTAVFSQINRVAVMMSKAGLAPSHLRGEDKVADCILVVAQALRWNSDPFAVAQHTFVTQGKLGYEGKLIAAMVNANPKLKENLNYEYDGEGDNRRVVVSGQFKGSDTVRKVDGTVGRWKTKNEFWVKNPDQMLAYRGAREWARRHMPEVLLGVNSEEEIAPRTMVDVTPAATTTASTLNQALAAAAAQGPTKGPEDLRTVDGEVVDAATGEILSDGDKAEADAKARENAANAELDATAYLTGIMEDADLCDTIAALDALDADAKKNLKPKSKYMQLWNSHKAKREDAILNPKG